MEGGFLGAAAAEKGTCRWEGWSCGMATRQEHPECTHHSSQGWTFSTQTVCPPHCWVSFSHPMSWEEAKEHPWALSCSFLPHVPLQPLAAQHQVGLFTPALPAPPGYSHSTNPALVAAQTIPAVTNAVSLDTSVLSDSFVAFHKWGN